MLICIRRGDMLRLRPNEITSAGIIVRPHKTANSSRLVPTFEWTPTLRAAVDMALVARPSDTAPWLFYTKRGNGYFDKRSGHDTGGSIWQRYDAIALQVRCPGGAPECAPAKPDDTHAWSRHTLISGHDTVHRKCAAG
jgi:hypothetical protein